MKFPVEKIKRVDMWLSLRLQARCFPPVTLEAEDTLFILMYRTQQLVKHVFPLIYLYQHKNLLTPPDFLHSP